MTSEISLKGKTLFITGASRGIGRAIALRCAREGANIIIAAKTKEPHPKLPGTIYTAAKEVEDAGGQALPIVVDVRNDDLVDAAVKQGAEHFGGIDAVINNAGAIMLTNAQMTPMKRVDLMFQVNVRGAYTCARAAIPYLKKSDNGHIINMSPPIDLDPKWFRNHTAYTISKYGMTMAMLGLSAELKGFGIGVNSLWPRTIIATHALKMVGGMVLEKKARTPEIMADAVHGILTSPGSELTGRQLIDEVLLREKGQTEFDHYSVEPGAELLPDLYVTEPVI
jgi:citronellol/citronellal dehydrogenase